VTRKIFVASLFILLWSPRAASQITTEALLDTIQHSAFAFFWNEANPANGLIKDRSTSGSPCSIASVGFGLTAIGIGVDHGWVTRAAARDRVLTTLRTFWTGPQGSGNAYIGNYGLFYHFLDMSTAKRTWSSELSTIDTALLLAGIIDAKQYFDGSDAGEAEIRALSDSIYYRMNWDLMRNYNYGIMMGWQPDKGFLGFGPWSGYNEASLMYLMAMGSPTYPVDSYAWQYWTRSYQWATYYGYSYVYGDPSNGPACLFFHQYSHCWYDFRGIADEYMRDKGITYFENSRRATLAQRAYAAANPLGHKGYSDSLWGITASDIPSGYGARGAPPARNDDGTVTPTAPISSIPFAPEAVLPVMRNLWNNYRSQAWIKYGFRDAFNLNVNWWDTDVIGIDQGPIIIMIENYLNGRVWKRFMKNADVQRGLQVAGFAAVPTAVEDHGAVPSGFVLEQNYPNPFNNSTIIRFTLPTAQVVRLRLFDMLGREIRTLAGGLYEAGTHAVVFDADRLSSGTYLYALETPTGRWIRALLLMK
jgi:hypothetical protein